MFIALFVAAALHLDNAHCATVKNISRTQDTSELQRSPHFQKEASDLFQESSDFVASDNYAPSEENLKKSLNQELTKVSDGSHRRHNNDSKIASSTVEGKLESDPGTQRQCPACIGDECLPNLSIITKFHGLPIKQILIAVGIGAAWAGVFAWILILFIKGGKHKDKGGYEDGYGYDNPVEEYGPPTTYGSPSHSVKRNGRSSQWLSFNHLSDIVWDAFDKFARLQVN